MKAIEFNELSGQQLESMSFKDLKTLVSAQGKNANKRITRIQNDKTASKDAVKSVEKSGGRFTIGGKNKRQLVREAKRIQRFNTAKTGTVKGARAVTEQRQKQVTGEEEKEAGKKAAKQARKEKKREIQKQREKKGLDKNKLTKKEKAKIKAAGNRARRAAEKKVREETEKKVKEFKKAKQEEQKKKRGKYYYAENDGQGAGVTGEETESDSSPKEQSVQERQEKLFKKEEAYQRKVQSPLELAGNSDKGDEDFTVASDVPFK